MPRASAPSREGCVDTIFHVRLGFRPPHVIAIALVGGALLLWQLSYVAVLVFAAVLVGVLISAAARRIAGRTGLRYSWAVILTSLLAAAVVAGFVWMIWTQLSQQIVGVLETLPDTLEGLAARFGWEIDIDFSQLIGSFSPDLLDRGMVGDVARYGMNAVSAVIESLLVVGAGVFFALDPQLYRRGALLVFPVRQRPRVAKAMASIGTALTGWFLGQLVIMIAVGMLSFLAYWLVGLPSALALAVIGGVLNFVPMLGPILAGAIAVLTAVGVGGDAVLWTLAAAIVIQEIESLVLVPRIQEWTVKVPAVLVIFSLAVFGTLFGILGILLAVPLALTVLVAVQDLWVNEALGEDVEIAGT